GWNYFAPAGTFTVVPGLNTSASLGGTSTNGFSSEYRHNSMGFLGGLQWGYNWQVGGLLIGFEGDWNWSNEKDTHISGASPINSFAGTFPVNSTSSQGWSSEEKIDWLTTWRARLGWAHDCYLWYVTAGVAWAKIEFDYTLVSTPGISALITGTGPGLNVTGTNIWGLPGGVAAANFSTTKTGWVAGGGVETSIGALLGPLFV